MSNKVNYITGKEPSVSDIGFVDMAFNTKDKKIFVKDANGEIMTLVEPFIQSSESEFGNVSSVGYYIKNANGSLIQWYQTSVIANATHSNKFGTTAGDMYYNSLDKSITFPLPFAYTPYITLSCQTNGMIARVRSGSITVDGVDVQAWSDVIDSTIVIQWIAIGRWK